MMKHFRSLFKGKKKSELVDGPATSKEEIEPKDIHVATSIENNKKKYKVFISHKQKDSQDLARIIHDQLESKCDVYLDVEDEKPLHVLQEAVEESEYFLIILSEEYMKDILENENGWCRKELEWASKWIETGKIILVLKQNMHFPTKQVKKLPEYLQKKVFVSKALEYRPGGSQWKAFFEDLEKRLEISQAESISFADYLEPKIKAFTGRKWLLKELKEWLKRNDEREKLLIIKGPPGIGKTTFMGELAYGEEDISKNILAYHFCRSQVETTLDTTAFIKSIVGMIQKKLAPVKDFAPSIKDIENDPMKSIEDLIIRMNKLEQKENTWIILVDALDEALLGKGHTTIVNVLAVIKNVLPSWMKIVCTSRDELDVMSMLNGNPSVIKELDATRNENTKDIEEYIEDAINRMFAKDGRGDLHENDP